MYSRITSFTAALVLPVAGWLTTVPTAAQERAVSAIEGTWIAGEHDARVLNLTLKWGSSTWGKPIVRSDVRGLPAGEPGSGPVSLRIERPAGTFQLEGAFPQGRFRFEPNPEFAQALRAMGIAGAGQVSGEELLKLAVAYRSAEEIRDLTTLELGSLSVNDVIELAVFDISADDVRSLRAAGIPGTRTPSGLVQLRVHRVTPAYVRELASLGYTDLSARQLLDMGIHGVGRAQVEALRELGYENVSPQTLVQMRIHGVTPEFIREARAAGFRNPSPSTLVQIRIHGIDSPYVRSSRN